MPKCKGCGAEIIFIKTAGGKAMPCDANPVVYWERKGAKNKIVTPNGKVKSCELSGEVERATGMGYIPHWATCPAAERFKTKGGEKL
jgi:hypothetical protein